VRTRIPAETLALRSRIGAGTVLCVGMASVVELLSLFDQRNKI
jgi:hypothetical protein